jgi:hypothetical protein
LFQDIYLSFISFNIQIILAICTTTYFERQKCDTPPYGHAPTDQISLTYLERQKCYGPDKKILFKKQLFDLEVKGQGPTKVITVRDTPSYGQAPTYQISLTHLERQKCYGPDKKILFKKQLFDLKPYHFCLSR